MEVHLYVPARTLETVKDELNKHTITHEYIVWKVLHHVFVKKVFIKIMSVQCMFVF